MKKSIITLESGMPTKPKIRVLVDHITHFTPSSNPSTGSIIHLSSGEAIHVRETPEKIEELISQL
ncbi:MAG TPA: hypothetical protein VFE32_11020 [Puia sp.]|jgi:hypothetical protein|nr:hypothetical protein [Puia sp.]